jgi:hypothetical protein
MKTCDESRRSERTREAHGGPSVQPARRRALLDDDCLLVTRAWRRAGQTASHHDASRHLFRVRESVAA